MDDNNRFLNSYRQKTAEQKNEQPAETPAETPESPSALRYEERSGFRPPRRAAPPPPPRGRRNPVLPLLLLAVVLVAVVAGAVWYFNRGIAVIDLTDWTLNDAQLWAGGKGVKLQVEEKYDDLHEATRIVSQDPAKGATVGKGGFVKITVSLGHDLTVSLPLPDLKSMTKDEIDAWAAENFMTKVRITAEYNDEVEAGKVISVTVNDNTVVDNVKRNTPIYVVVSKGRENDADVLITVPNFREKTLADCYVFANENGIVLKITEQYDDFAPEGSILSQSVKADEKVRKGDEITLVVSKGKKITVPDFSDYTKTKATAVAGELNIPIAVNERYSSRPAGELISQSIPADSVYQKGDVLELDYSLGNKVIVADYVGQTEDAIEAWAKGLNDQGASIVIRVTYTQSNQPKGKILYQDKANRSIGISATIRITVSKGKAVFVPDFVGPAGSGYDVAITREEAMAMCEALNLVPVFVEARNSSRLPGEVWQQSIAAGTEISEGSTITLKYVPVTTKVSVPNFTGMTKAQIRAAGYLKKFDITFVTDDAVVGYAGRVARQSLRAGSQVACGSALTLTMGPEGGATASPSPS